MDIHNILENLRSVEGVQGAFLIDEQGNIIDSATEQDNEAEYISGLVAGCVDSGKGIAGSIIGSPLKQSYIEFSDLNLTFDLLDNGAILALLASSGSNLGRIRLEIRKTKKEVETMMS